MKNQSVARPYIALSIAVIAISTSAIFVKLVDSPAPVTAFYRLFFSVLLMTPIVLVKYTKEIRQMIKKDVILSIGSGVLLAFHFIIWFESLNYTSVTSSVVLVTLQPIFAFLGSYLIFKESLTRGAILGGALAVGGSFVISWGDFRVSGIALFGDVLALLACALVTAYWLVGREIRNRVSLMTYTYVVYTASTITIFLYVLLFRYSFVPKDTNDWMYFFLLALLPTLLGHTLINWAVKWISVSTISMSILFEPVGAAILAYFLLNERVSSIQLIGSTFIIIGIGFYLWSQNKKRLRV